jgi:O-antigen/teichoic acid export membrane protein
MDKIMAKAMLIYAVPLMIAGFAGIINETFDRILLKRLLLSEGAEYAQSQVGIYSANYKLSILISLFIQAYRYAAEPFFFAQAKKKDGHKTYSKIMTFFVIIVSFIFLIIALNISIFKWFIPNEAYWEGLTIVPILLLANVFLGIYYNQSIWYKLADKTRYGAYIALGGAIITLTLNILLIPILGYMGSAITTLVVYFAMMVTSYFYGKKHYPIKYNLRKIGLYIFSALALYGLSRLIQWNQIDFNWTTFIINGVLLLIFTGIVLFIERPLRQFRKG